MNLTGVFGSANHIAWWQECVRSTLVFGYALLAIRLSGRRTFAHWSAVDIVVAVIIGSSLSRTITGNAPLLPTLAGTTIMLIIHRILVQAAARSKAISEFLEGVPVVLAYQGRVDTAIMHKRGISEADLGEAVRKSGLGSSAEARLIVLEPSGEIHILKR